MSRDRRAVMTNSDIKKISRPRTFTIRYYTNLITGAFVNTARPALHVLTDVS